MKGTIKTTIKKTLHFKFFLEYLTNKLYGFPFAKRPLQYKSAFLQKKNLSANPVTAQLIQMTEINK